MTMLEIHKKALSSTQPIYHEFLSRYSNDIKAIYAFVEGKEDPCFYRGFIENDLPDEWNLELWSVGSRDKVLSLYREFDWIRFSKMQILFFIDKDITPFLGIADPCEPNLYITDKYSIENSIIDKTLCDRVLTEVFGLQAIQKKDKDAILTLFEKEYSRFRECVSKIMVWIILWRRNGEKPRLNDIPLNDIFNIDKGKLKISHKPCGFKSIPQFIHAKCEIPYPSYPGFKKALSEFNKHNGKDAYIRGKYLVWFFVHFVLSIYQNISLFSGMFSKPPKINVSFGAGNFAVLVAPRARCPRTLRSFLSKACYSREN
jgi:hypothetical protein